MGVAVFVAYQFYTNKFNTLKIVQKQAPLSNEHVTLMIKRGGTWLYHSMRPKGHPDIEETLRTPGMAIFQDGTLIEGKAKTNG